MEQRAHAIERRGTARARNLPPEFFFLGGSLFPSSRLISSRLVWQLFGLFLPADGDQRSKRSLAILLALGQALHYFTLCISISFVALLHLELAEGDVVVVEGGQEEDVFPGDDVVGREATDLRVQPTAWCWCREAAAAPPGQP